MEVATLGMYSVTQDTAECQDLDPASKQLRVNYPEFVIRFLVTPALTLFSTPFSPFSASCLILFQFLYPAIACLML